jgi:predicted DNA-binding protein YlxM (UPF0122 family)
MSIDRTARMSILFDYYGLLLTEKQRRIFTLYHEDNLSLSEIGDELALSKQGVHDALKKAEAMLEDYEGKLKLIEDSRINQQLSKEIKTSINNILVNLKQSETGISLSNNINISNEAAMAANSNSEIQKKLNKIETDISKLKI